MVSGTSIAFPYRSVRLAMFAVMVIALLHQSDMLAKQSEIEHAPQFGVAINARVTSQIPDFLPYYGVQSVTPDNAMKMEVIGGCDGWFDFSGADQLIDYAELYGFELHGHAVVWHRQTSWCVDSYTKADYETYVRTVVGHFCGRVATMDVVNEALGKDDPFRTEDESAWRRLYGNDDYIADAFRWARETCPEMKLYYNDYLIEWGEKSKRMLALVEQLSAEGLIDGVGFQSHFDRRVKFDRFAEVMERVADLGLEIAISELDVRMGEPYWDLTEEDFLAQADIYRRIAELCKQQPACVRLTVWGIDDEHSWINVDPEFGMIPDAPLLFDRGYWPKPAYCDGIQDVLNLPEGDCPLVQGG